MPTNSFTLQSEISHRRLTLVSGYPLVTLKNLEAHAQGEAQALKVARLLTVVGGE